MNRINSRFWDHIRTNVKEPVNYDESVLSRASVRAVVAQVAEATFLPYGLIAESVKEDVI